MVYSEVPIGEHHTPSGSHPAPRFILKIEIIQKTQGAKIRSSLGTKSYKGLHAPQRLQGITHSTKTTRQGHDPNKDIELINSSIVGIIPVRVDLRCKMKT